MALHESERESSCDYTLVKNCLFGEQMSQPILILSDETPSVRSRIERSRAIAAPRGDRFARRVSLPYDKSLAIKWDWSIFDKFLIARRLFLSVPALGPDELHRRQPPGQTELPDISESPPGAFALEGLESPKKALR